MNTETITKLDAETIEGLQDLIQVNLDSAKGFVEAARRVENESLRVLFTEIGREREKNATELQQYVEHSGGRACQDGSLAAAFHRVWLDFRGRLAGGDAHVILTEAERGEDHIVQVYKEVLVRNTGSALSSVLNRQFSSVNSGHNKVRDLRDGYK